MTTETLLIGDYPRDDIRWPEDGRRRTGTAEVFAPDGQTDAVERVQLGDFDVRTLDFPVDANFTVRIAASDGEQSYEGTFRFRVTDDEHDAGHYTVGPGVRIERGRWGRKTVDGFEFGVTVMGAVPAPD